MNNIQIVKRNGNKENIDLEKIHKVLLWATDDISGVSVSDIELNSQIQFYDGMTSKEIHGIMVKSAADLISEETPNYQYVAARLINFDLRKEVYGGIEPCTVKELAKKNVKLGHYDPLILEKYTEDELDHLDLIVKHQRDWNFAYVGMEQFRGKYLVKDRVNGDFFETPQMLYIMVSAMIFMNYDKTIRMKYVREFYNAISNFDISLPTPIMGGVRTPQRQFSSCVLIDSDDSLDSINATTTSIVKYISQKAGIGINAGRLRALGSKIRKGDTMHTGLIPFLKLFQSAVKSCSQGGIRGGAATVYLPLWHYEFEELVVLKNNKGTEETRVRHMDYAFQFNKLMYERLVEGGDITLFSPHDVPGMYDAYFNDQDKFKELYEKAERNPKIRKKIIKAIDAFSAFMSERKDTGRIYLMNVDHANTHSSFKEDIQTVYQSNLCAEITLPTKPLVSAEDPDGRIQLCTLGAINWGNIKTPSDFAKPCELVIRALDEILTNQEYPIFAAQEATREFRTLGIGIVNLAYFLAKNGVGYDDTGLELVDEYAEAWSYYLIKASADLAKEKGACDLSEDTKYHDGILPIDTYKKDVDELVTHEERMPWNDLREQLQEYGIRNATLMACMPSETSAQISNATNGIEPPRAFISEKQSKDGVLKQVVPEFPRLKNKYQLLWDQEDPQGYLKVCAVLQKYMDQSISTNTSYNPAFFDDDKVPMSKLLGDLLLTYKYGLKTLYYCNTNDGAGEIDVDKMDKSVDLPSEIDYNEEENCDSCMI